MGVGSNNCERSEQTERLHEAFTEVQWAAPWRGSQGGSTPLPKKFGILQAEYAPLPKKIWYFAS